MARKNKESNQYKKTEIMTSVSSVVNYMKQQVKSDLVEAKHKGSIDLSEEDLKKICFYVESSLTNSFTRASDQIESLLK